MGVEAHEGSRVPEGQAIHRLARIASGFLAGRVVAASSPQGRFAEGAARLDGLTAFHAQAWGKHFFMPFAESRTPTAEPLLGDDGPAWLHVHLGLYGRWSFSGPRATDVAGAGLRGGGNAAAVVGAKEHGQAVGGHHRTGRRAAVIEGCVGLGRLV